MNASKKLWVTYAWRDNEDKDIDFIIQELDETGLDVKFDRRNLIPGQRLWQQIGGIITDPSECDAWGMIVTRNSIVSEPCIEELSYALTRALSARSNEFPIIGLLHNVETNELPPSLQARLCIVLEDSEWVRQVVAAVNQQPPGFLSHQLEPFEFKLLPSQSPEMAFSLEIRSRLDRISPFCIAVDINEKPKVKGYLCGPSGILPNGSVKFGAQEGETELSDGTKICYWQSNNEASSTQSYYLLLYEIPRRICVGNPHRNMKWFELLYG
jgi:hypothetical protein